MTAYEVMGWRKHQFLEIYHCTADGEVGVVLVEDHSPGKVRHLLGASPWVYTQ
jgi:hypothetical protein